MVGYAFCFRALDVYTLTASGLNKVNDFFFFFDGHTTTREKISVLGEIADTQNFFLKITLSNLATDMREIMRELVVSIDEDLDVSSVFRMAKKKGGANEETVSLRARFFFFCFLILFLLRPSVCV